MLADAAANGLTNTRHPCLNEATGKPANPNYAGYLYFDRIHTTAAAHRLIGDAITAQVNRAPALATWAMIILGFGVIGYCLRRVMHRSEIAFDARIRRITAGMDA